MNNLTEELTQTKLCTYCEYILKCMAEAKLEDQYKELNSNQAFKVDKYKNSPCLPIIEEALSSVRDLDVPNISKIIAEYGITTKYNENGYTDITKYYWGEIIKESPTVKSQTILDPTHSYIVKYKEWTKGIYDTEFTTVSHSYLSENGEIIREKCWNRDTSHKKLTFVFKDLNFKRWKNVSVKLDVGFHYSNGSVKKFIYFEDDKYLHDAEVDSVNKVIGITHLPKDLNPDENYTIIDNYTPDKSTKVDTNSTSILKFSLIAISALSALTAGFKYYNKLKLN